VENPMLGFVDEYFLGPFDQHETSNLLRKLGRGMLLSWDDHALTRFQEATGGYPFLIRDLASVARRIARAKGADASEEVRVTESVVDEAIDRWRDQAAELWQQITQTLRMHYELAAEMASSESDTALLEWLRLGDEAERAARSLEGLGLLVQDGNAWHRSATLISLQRLRRAKTADLSTLRKARVQASDVRSLISQDESQRLEFKATARINLSPAS